MFQCNCCCGKGEAAKDLRDVSCKILFVVCFLWFIIVVRSKCPLSLLPKVSEERPDRQLVLQGGVQQGLLLQLLQLLSVSEVQRVGPQVCPSVDESWTQRLSSKRVHKWRLGDGCWGEHLLGFANLGVGLSKLQTDGLRQIWVEPHALLQVLLGRLRPRPAAKCDEAHR